MVIIYNYNNNIYNIYIIIYLILNYNFQNQYIYEYGDDLFDMLITRNSILFYKY